MELAAEPPDEAESALPFVLTVSRKTYAGSCTGVIRTP